MSERNLVLAAAVIAASLLLSGCSSQNDSIAQYSTINALMAGSYDGEFKCREIARTADFGIGTFDRLDGEMVLLDGTVYQVKSDGTVRPAMPDESTPFAAVTSFNTDKQLRLEGTYDFAQLQKQIDALLPTPNIFYAIRVDAQFEYVRTRSVPAQQKPYPRLSEVVKTQPVFETVNTAGVLVGFKCPDYIFPLNVPGYHMHFISNKRDFGGHLLQCRAKDPIIMIDCIRGLELTLPSGKDFDTADLRTADQASLNKAEK